MPTPIDIPPLVPVPDDATLAQTECYVDRAEDYLAAVQACYKAGGTVQACITSAHNNYIAGLGICDTL